jgi:hypothetical protein
MALCLPTFSLFLIVNKLLSLSLLWVYLLRYMTMTEAAARVATPAAPVGGGEESRAVGRKG